MPEIQKIKAQLEAKLAELYERAEDIDADLSEPPDANWSENAVESENDEVLEGVGALTMAEIQQIKQALAKIENGTYGICVKCDEKIAIKRLEALPYATTCIKCAAA
ncbi:MAG: TraR/DksA family transcriptional regulator [Rhodospirillaceae bacterium]